MGWNRPPNTGWKRTFLPAGAATTPIKTTAGVVHAIEWEAVASSVCVLYDHPSATTNPRNQFGTDFVSGQQLLDCEMQNGITVDTDANWAGGAIYWL